jgi:FlaG/FlaF family flagellin (archaellin)
MNGWKRSTKIHQQRNNKKKFLTDLGPRGLYYIRYDYRSGIKNSVFDKYETLQRYCRIFQVSNRFHLYINKSHTDTIFNGSWDAMIKNMRSKLAVSEVVGVVLLLGIAISLFAVLNFFVTSFSFHESGPLVSLKGTTNIIITIGTTTYQRSIREILNHTDNAWKLFASSTDINPDKWDFSETVQFSFKGIDITDKYVQARVVDPIKNTILLSIVFQQGLYE